MTGPRVLPHEDWSKLDHTELATVWRDLHPAYCQVLVVEDGERIIGCWALLNMWHVEGLWIDPAYRNTGIVARRLLHGMRTLTDQHGAAQVITTSVSPDVTDYLQRLGATPFPGQSFVLKLRSRDLISV